MKEIITSKDNSNIKLYMKLCASKKARNEYNMFAIEGVRLISDAILENAELNCILVTKIFMEKYSEAVNLLRERQLYDKVLIITDELAERLSDTKSPQGIFAIVQKLDKKKYTDTIIKGKRFLIVNNLQDPGNIGTIIRTADAVGIDAVFINNNSCDLYNPKIVRSTMGSLFRQVIVCNFCYDEIIDLMKKHDITTYAAVIDKDADSITNTDFAKKAAVVIGNEGNGLSKTDADSCDKKITIKMNGNINSLNAAMAAGIIMWEMTR